MFLFSWPLCTHLLCSVWIIGVVGVLGNLFVIVSRSVFHEIKPIHSFYIKNLAVADLFIGIFLISIGFHDIKFRGQFLMFQHTWRLSLTCQFSGANKIGSHAT